MSAIDERVLGLEQHLGQQAARIAELDCKLASQQALLDS
eukprot:SAG22_NODE_15362_length_350_cov_1.239044_1_plen_38_part_10